MEYRLFNRILKFLESQPKLDILLIVVIGIATVASLDFVTGFEVSLSLFYLFPVSLATWILGKKAGVFVSCLSAITWLFVNYILNEYTSSPLLYLWNSLIRFGFFYIVTLLLSALHILIEKEKSLARTDFLTNVLNRRAFYEHLQAEILRDYRYGNPFTLVYIDLDGFKMVNDQFGHHTGDVVLQVVARVITKHIRNIDQIGRLGGDEFCILLIETDSQSAKKIVNRMQELLLVEMERNQWKITFSIGVVTYLQNFLSVEDVINLADQLMYTVKTTGKNNIKYYVH